VRTRRWARTESGIPSAPGAGPAWRPSPRRPDRGPADRISWRSAVSWRPPVGCPPLDTRRTRRSFR
jgi:hypothetical protein